METEVYTARRLEVFTRCAVIRVTLTHFQGKTPMLDTQKLCYVPRASRNYHLLHRHAQ
jgi:hypothetical protein